jgi:predicted nucleotidyltransferase
MPPGSGVASGRVNARDALIDEISRRLADATPARTRVVPFGSRARRENGERSDVDVLVH